MQGTAAISDEDRYDIEGSLRFESSEGPNLRKYLSQSGDGRRWTVSFWFKKTMDNNLSTYLWGAYEGGKENQFYFKSTGEIQWYWNPSYYVETVDQFNDVSSWYHLVATFDSYHPTDTERVKLYINGRKLTLTANTLPAQYVEADWNRKGGFVMFGGTRIGRSGHWQFADIQSIDGLTLSPTAFGSFDSTGVWNPKTFSRPAPNNGTTWSSKLYTSNATYNGSATATNFQSGHGATEAFSNVLEDNGAVGNESDPYAGWIYFRPTSAFEGVSNLRIYCAYVGDFKLNGVSVNTTPAPVNGTGRWYDIEPTAIPASLTEIAVKGASGSNGRIAAIEVDGVILVDGTVDPTDRPKLNDGTVHSSTNTTGSAYEAYPIAQAFNGTHANRSVPASDSWVTWTPPTAIEMSKLRIYFAYKTTNGNFKINGTQNNTNLASGTYGWIEYTGYTSISSIAWYCGPSGAEQSSVAIIEIDGQYLLDSVVDNSFHMKLSDTTVDSSLGRNFIGTNLGIEDSSVNGGLPFYNTTAGSDGYDNGAKKGSGYRTDSSAGTTDGTGLVFALPGDGLTDEHDHVNTGSSAKTVTISNSCDTTTVDSRFYGKSLDFGAYNVAKNVHVTAANAGSDFNFGTGDFTVECWFYQTDDTRNGGSNQTVFDFDANATNSYGGGWLWLAITDANLVIYYSVNSNSLGYQTVMSSASLLNSWTHFAVVYDSTNSKLKTFVNGELKTDTSYSTDWTGDRGVYLGQMNLSSDMNRTFAGYINDFRVYKGVSKYTSAFVVPKRDDFLVDNLTATATGTIYTSGSDWTSAIWDGSTSTQGGVTGQSYEELTSQSITVNTSFEIFTNDENGQVNTIKDGNGNEYQCDSDAGTGSHWRPLYNANSQSGTNFTGTLAGPIQVKVSYGGSHIYAVRVDGTIVTDDPLSGVDFSTDSPTNYEPAVGSDATGGVTRGNYATMNPLTNINWGYGSWTLRQGNLEAEGYPSSKLACTLGASSGKYYWEVEYVNSPNTGYIGIIHPDADIHADWNVGTQAAYGAGGNKNIDGSTSAYGNTYTAGDVIGVQWDADNGNLYFWKNGVAENSGTALVTGKTGLFVPFFSTSSANNANNVKFRVNFGQRPFKYQNAGSNRPSADYKCLCTTNLPDTFSGDQINDPSKYFDVKTYVGNGVDDTDIKGFNFGPDLVWTKMYGPSGGGYHPHIWDQARGATKYFITDGNNVQGTQAEGIKAFNSDGFQLGTFIESGYEVGKNYVAWAWDAGATAATASTDGNITPSAQWVNATAGFSITLYSGLESAGKTVGHALGAKPDLVMCKNTLAARNWVVWHNGLDKDEHLILNTNDDVETSATVWDDLDFTNTVVTLGANEDSNRNGNPTIMYAWTAIPGYSAFGTYIGSGVSPNFVYTGFQPKLLIVKPNISGENWIIWDDERSPYNLTDKALRGNTTDLESTYAGFKKDFVSNGFVTKSTDAIVNTNGTKYYYMAWAEHPFKKSRAR